MGSSFTFKFVKNICLPVCLSNAAKNGFPKSIYVSVNEEVVHGIPSDKIIEKGDLVSVDFCVSYNGMITDSAFTQAVELLNVQTRP